MATTQPMTAPSPEKPLWPRLPVSSPEQREAIHKMFKDKIAAAKKPA